MLTELVALLRQHKLALPADLALLVKAFITLEGLGRSLDPDFDMVGTAQPMLEEVIRERYAPINLLKRGAISVGQLFSLLSGLPADLSRVLRAARRGRLEINIEVGSLKRVGNQIDRAANRLAVGVVIAALIIGSSIILTVPGGPRLFGLPVLGVLGFTAAVFGGIWLLLSIWNTRHDE
jgi:ubiquinone biosynthesis protein